MRVLVFDPSRCTGCHTCEETCSQTWFKVVDRGLSSIQIVEPEGDGLYQAITCTQCGECIDVCPTQALGRAKNGVVRRDLALCVGCLACVGFCRVGAPHGAAMRSDNAHLRTRVPESGMTYKGFNIAIHELGHNVEQVAHGDDFAFAAQLFGK